MKPSTIIILLAAIGGAIYFLTRPVPKPTTPLDVLAGGVKVVGQIGEAAAGGAGQVAVGVTKLPVVKQAMGIVNTGGSAIIHAGNTVAHYINPFNW